jgi:hypothetical protein
MAAGEFEEGTTPAIRDTPEEHPCPFCGKNTLIRSYGDLSDDNFRVELYCNNSHCDTREMMVIAKRMNGSISDRRADVAAIVAVDDGTEAEQEEEGVELIRDEHGEVIGSMLAAGNLNTELFLERGARLMNRRERPTKIIVEPK